MDYGEGKQNKSQNKSVRNRIVSSFIISVDSVYNIYSLFEAVLLFMNGLKKRNIVFKVITLYTFNNLLTKIMPSLKNRSFSISLILRELHD